MKNCLMDISNKLHHTCHHERNWNVRSYYLKNSVESKISRSNTAWLLSLGVTEGKCVQTQTMYNYSFDRHYSQVIIKDAIHIEVITNDALKKCLRIFTSVYKCADVVGKHFRQRLLLGHVLQGSRYVHSRYPILSPSFSN